MVLLHFWRRDWAGQTIHAPMSCRNQHRTLENFLQHEFGISTSMWRKLMSISGSELFSGKCIGRKQVATAH